MEQTRLQTAVGDAKLKSKKAPTDGDSLIRPKLADEVQEIIAKNRFAVEGGPNAGREFGDDNSNTQFAVLGLWAARKHGLPVDTVLARAEQRFRLSQSPNGGWDYQVGAAGHSSPSMTCAGLLALAVGIGNRGESKMRAAAIGPDGKLKVAPKEGFKPEIKNPMADQAVQRGFAYLAEVLAGRAASAGVNIMPVGNPGAAKFGGVRSNLYFLWSMERVCMVYNVPTNFFRNVDWHQWGAEALISMQQKDGSFNGGENYGFEVDTAFALMFLCRANLVKDLTRLMKAKPDMKFAPSKGTDTGPGTAPGTGAVVKEKDKPPTADSNPTAMAKALAEATGTKYAELLKLYTDSKGAAFTQALAEAIPQLTGETQKQARTALVERMTRFSASTLRERFKDENPEMRRAAVIAAAEREEKDLIPDLIDALADRSELVVRGARAALRSFTDNKLDYGPPPGYTEAQRNKAIVDWRNWYKKQSN